MQKKLALKCLLSVYKLDFIMLQETMFKGHKDLSILLPLLQNSHFNVADTGGLSGGLLSRWNPSFNPCFVVYN